MQKQYEQEPPDLAERESIGSPADLTLTPNAKDTIPADLKRYIFTDKSMPNLLNDYDVLGFDADHCIVKYNVRELMIHVSNIQGLDMHTKGGYPAEIAHYEPGDLGLCLNNTVWDIPRGNLLKLTEGKVITRAYHGRRPLLNQEICTIYGSPPIFSALDYPTCHRRMDQSEDSYWILMTYFDCCKIPLICQGIELIDQGVVQVSYFQFSLDFLKSVLRQYAHFDKNKYHSIQNFGEFFPEVVKNTSKYIQAQPNLRQSLERLVKGGKRLFLATNSHIEYADFIMTHTLGEDWRTLFDLSFVYAQKPVFFNNPNQPCYYVDETQENYKGSPITNSQSLKRGDVLIEGNFKLVESFFSSELDKKDIKFAFFGDHYLTDVECSAACKGDFSWDAIAVIEELSLYDQSLEMGMPADHVLTRDRWGPSYFIEEVEGSEQVQLNYFVNQVAKVARYALPFVKNINLMIS